MHALRVCRARVSAVQIWRVNPTTKPKTYTFYFVSADAAIAAARSSAGGLALLRK